MDELYNLNLHETIEFGKESKIDCQVMRVPGGWIYRFFQLYQELGGDGRWSENYVADSVFVPFDNEFEGRD